MHLRLDDLRKQARMLQMYESERTRTRSAGDNASIQVSGAGMLSSDPGQGQQVEFTSGMSEPVQPID